MKIRGHRIEPAEVEAALLALDGVEQAAVMADNGAAGPELIACVAGRVDADALRGRLAMRLPEYMVPARVVVCDQLPLTAHGKLDRDAVRALGDRSDTRPSFETPATERERTLAEIWSAVLGVDQVGRHDRFVGLGGDSIKSIQILARLRARGLDLELKDLFAHPTLAELAPRLTERRRAAPAADPESPFALTPIQRWFFEEYGPADRAHFNHALLLRSAVAVDPAAVERALQSIVDAHGALRLRFEPAGDGTWRQRIAPKGARVPFTVVDLRDHADPRAEVHRLSEREQTGIRLDEGPLFRAAVYRLPDGDRLLLVAHHLAVDGVTWRILLEELTAVLAQGTAPAATDSFACWARALEEQARQPPLASELAFWGRMDGNRDDGAVDVPFDGGEYRDAHEELLEWNAADTDDLRRRACAAYRTNAGELLLAAVARALGRWIGQPRLRVALESHGRQAMPDCDVSRTAGWFTALYPFVLDLSDRPVSDCVRQLKEDLRRVPNGGTGYGILRYLSLPGSDVLRARPSVSFNYLGEFTGAFDGLWSLCADPVWPSAAPAARRPFALEIAALVADGRLRVSLTYPGRAVSRHEARRLGAAVDEELRVVVDHCIGTRVPHLTPADLTHKDVTLEELESLFDED